MDTSNMLWIKPPLSAEGTKAPSAREYCAAVFDPKGARMLFFGGWANCWLGDVHSLNVSGIVGPSYAVTDVRPIRGPLSGGRAVTVVGINFVPHPKIEVKFINGNGEEIVPGKYQSPTEITCISPSFESSGAGEVEVKVLIGTEIYTVNRVFYKYYNDTKASSCIAYGPGLTAERSFGTPASFVLQAKDTKGKNRTSGTDTFTCRLVLNGGTKDEESFEGEVFDHDNGTYTITYIPPAPGMYSVNVCLGSDHIRGSPFPVTCSDPWERPRLTGPPNNVSDDRQQLINNGNLITFVDGKMGLDAKDPVNIFDSTECQWQPAVISGTPPAKKQNNVITRNGDTMMQFGGRPRGATDTKLIGNSVDLLMKEKHSNSWAWTTPVPNGTAPTEREFSTATGVTGSASMIVTGGTDCGLTTDVHLLNIESASVVEWVDTVTEGEAPVGRSGHAAALVQGENQMYVFGGQKDKSVIEAEAAAAASDEAGVTDGEANQADGTALSPPEAEEEENAEVAADGDAAEGEAPAEAPTEEEPEEEKIQLLNDMSRLNFDLKDKTFKWEAITAEGAPSPRMGHQLEVIDGKVVVYGGMDADGKQLYDMHTYDPLENTWRCVYKQKPPPDNKPTKVFFNAATKQLVALDGASGTYDAMETLDLGPMLFVEESLIDQMAVTAEETLTELEDFVNKEGLALDTKVEEGDLDRLLKVMGALHDVLSQQDGVDLRMDSLTESVAFLQEQEMDMSTINNRLNDMKGNWIAVKKRAPKIKAGIRTFQEREGRKIKHEIARFAEKMETFRDQFKAHPFFIYDTGAEESYEQLLQMDSQLEEVEARRGELEHLATLFECKDLVDKPTKLVSACREDLGLVKVYWDCVAMVNSYFTEWKRVPWDDIQTDSMEDATKKFKNELRIMDKKIRQEFAAYSDLLQVVNDMLAAIPVIGDLRQDCMRERHWLAIVEMTGVQIDVENIPKLFFEDLLGMKLHEYVEDVSEIVDRAQKEEKIEKNLVMLQSNWAHLDFEFTPYNDTELNLVKVSEETFDTRRQSSSGAKYGSITLCWSVPGICPQLAT